MLVVDGNADFAGNSKASRTVVLLGAVGVIGKLIDEARGTRLLIKTVGDRGSSVLAKNTNQFKEQRTFWAIDKPPFDIVRRIGTVDIEEMTWQRKRDISSDACIYTPSSTLDEAPALYLAQCTYRPSPNGVSSQCHQRTDGSLDSTDLPLAFESSDDEYGACQRIQGPTAVFDNSAIGLSNT